MSTSANQGTIPGLDIAFLQQLFEANGYYHCPNADGRLVAYAGRYKLDPEDRNSDEIQYVGDAYYNLAKVEDDPAWLELASRDLAHQLEDEYLFGRIDRIVGLPQGGLAIASHTARQLAMANYWGNRTAGRSIYPDKKVLALATPTSREKSEMRFGRHDPPNAGESVVLFEDVVNNRSSSAQAAKLIRDSGAKVAALACIVRRCAENELEPGVPIVSICDFLTPQFRQDDPAVIDRVQRGLVSWKPKEEWDSLMTDMGRVA